MQQTTALTVTLIKLADAQIEDPIDGALDKPHGVETNEMHIQCRAAKRLASAAGQTRLEKKHRSHNAMCEPPGSS